MWEMFYEIYDGISGEIIWVSWVETEGIFYVITDEIDWVSLTDSWIRNQAKFLMKLLARTARQRHLTKNNFTNLPLEMATPIPE